MQNDTIVVFDKDYLIGKLKEIAASGWIANARHGNHGGIGNTLEDLLGIKENNLPIPNAAEWELKATRYPATAHTTLVHLEPSPRAVQLVAKVLVPKYGWPHKEAGKKYPEGALSFRQTINGLTRTDRGFQIIVDRAQRKILVSFDHSRVAEHHRQWLLSVQARAGLGELDPQPYWGFDDLEHIVGTKLLNCFYVQAEVKKENERELYRYSKVMMLQRFRFDKFLVALEEGELLVDFDARSGKNHGTKFRMRESLLPTLYEKVTVIM
jgi:hypothetical protein